MTRRFSAARSPSILEARNHTNAVIVTTPITVTVTMRHLSFCMKLPLKMPDNYAAPRCNPTDAAKLDALRAKAVPPTG